MAKKKQKSSKNQQQQQQQQHHQQQISDAWEVDSVVSCSTELSDKAGGIAEQQSDDVLYDLIESLFEKRSSTRITALQHIQAFLSQSVAVEECEEKMDDLVNRIVNCVSKGGSDEILGAAKVAGFLCITMGMEDDNDRLIEQLISPFKKILKQSSKSVSCKAAVLETVAIMCFVSVEDSGVLMECLSMLESQFGSQEPQIKVSALRGWSLIFSNLSMGDIDMRKIEDGLFGELSHMLQMSNIDVRGAAGEALAVINHRFDGLNLEDYMEDEEEDWDSESVVCESMSSTVTDAMEGVKDRMRDLVKNRGDQQRKSRKARASQRSQFRELLQLVEHGEVKREELKLRYGDRMVVEGLEAKIQLNAIRKYLGGGFQQHLQNNQLLHNIFDYKPTTTKVEKSAFSSAYGKAKTQRRNNDRKYASAKKGGIYEQEDY
eukprot:TRINITY_DN14484_c2_g1_i1.p1 TRINITY_DN14484_c2_g1~~TRINITY_DN14484_c2_g1_i1.p1  ORF type:complete len:432 (-),score=105.10 TRINITY_DN14484_c2_g1_i1:369-1664(-)